MGDQRQYLPQKENSEAAPAEKSATGAKTPAQRGFPHPPRVSGKLGGSTLDDIPLTPENILFLQRTIGNQATVRFVQRRLKIGQPNDPYEREADHVAEQVMRMPEPSPSQPASFSIPTNGMQIQRADSTHEVELRRQSLDEEKKRKRLEEEGTVSAKESPGETPALSPKAESQINNLQSGGGEPLSESARAYFEPRFGQDFSGVRVHHGSQAAESAQAINARAYTTGQDVVFGAGEYTPETTEGKTLLAHELTHVVQQSSVLTSGGMIAQRFEEKEHWKIGEEATKGVHGEVKTVQLAEDYRVTYGEMVAMAGDHFESIEQMRSFAKNLGSGAGSREEIEYIRVVKVHGQKDKKDGFSKSAVEAADQRYYKLAGDNRSHFLNPEKGDETRSTVDKADDTVKKIRIEWNGSIPNMVPYDAPAGAGAGYRYNHTQALWEAYFAGRLGESIDVAFAVEAFGAHYLTDAFSSGHVRTARAGIVEHWNKRVPMFYYNLQGFIAEKLAEKLEKEVAGGIFTEEAIYKGPLWFAGSLQAVNEALRAKGEIAFGDLVSGAIHDYDNKRGVQVSIEGKEETIYGDLHLGEGAEKPFAIKAVRLSYQEIEKAWEVGKAAANPLAILTATMSDGLFAAERLLPKPKAESELPPEKQPIKWDYDDVGELFGDAKFQEAVKIFCMNKAGEFEEVASSLDDAQQQEAFKKQVVEPLKKEPVNTVWAVINWTPDTGGGVFGHNQDDNAMDYYKTSKKQGALGTLTWVQKTSLIIDIIDGPTIGDEDDAIWDLLTVKESDAQAIIDWIGWGRLEDEIDGWFGNKFKSKFPKEKRGDFPLPDTSSSATRMA